MENETPWLKPGEVKPGDIIFLPEYGYFSRFNKEEPPYCLKDHLYLVIDVFPSNTPKTDPDLLWVFVISGTTNNIYNGSNPNPLHIPFFDTDSPACTDIPRHKHDECTEHCGDFLFMEGGIQMVKPSYVNASRIYEWPLSCFKPNFDEKKLRNCSLEYVWRLAAGVIADEVIGGVLHARTAYRLPVYTSMEDGRGGLVDGRLCWLQSDEGVGAVAYGDRARTPLKLRGAGLCVIVDVGFDEHHNQSEDESVTVCAILDRRASQSLKPRFRELTWPIPESLLPIAALSPREPYYSLNVNSGDDITFVDEHMLPVSGSLPEQSVVCYPVFRVRRDALWQLTQSYTLGRQRLSDESLGRVKEVWGEHEERYDREEPKSSFAGVLE